MIKFTIYDSNNTVCAEFSTSQETQAFTIGTSPLCTISLEQFADTIKEVQESHFAILKENHKWFIKSPNHPLKTNTGQNVLDLEITTDMTLLFGNCILEVNYINGTSRYNIAWITPNSTIERSPILSPKILIGAATQCDIIIPNTAPKHCYLSYDEPQDSFQIKPADENVDITIDGSNITKETSLPIETSFLLGDTTCEIIPKENIIHNIYVHKKQFNWKFLNLFLLLTLTLLAVLLFKKHTRQLQQVTQHNIELLKNKAQTKETLFKQLNTYINKGELLPALELLNKNRKTFSSKKEFNTLYKAVTTEYTAVENYFFFMNQCHKDISKERTLFYLNLIWASQEKKNPLLLNISYWETIKSKIVKLTKQINTHTAPIFKTYKIDSFYLKHYKTLIQKIKEHAYTMNLYKETIEQWHKKEWKKTIETLEKIKAILQLVNYQKLYKKVDMAIHLLKQSQHIKELQIQFNSINFKQLNTASFEATLNGYRTTLETFKTFIPTQYEKQKKSLHYLSKQLTVANELKKRYKIWSLAKDNSLKIKNLVSYMGEIDNTILKAAIVSNAIEEISKHISKHLTRTISSLPVTGEKESLNKCIKIEALIMELAAFGNTIDTKLLHSKKEKIEQLIQYKCNTIFNSYKIAATHNNTKEMKRQLTELLKIAPKNSTYYIWAKKQK